MDGQVGYGGGSSKSVTCRQLTGQSVAQRVRSEEQQASLEDEPLRQQHASPLARTHDQHQNVLADLAGLNQSRQSLHEKQACDRLMLPTSYQFAGSRLGFQTEGLLLAANAVHAVRTKF